MVKRPALRSSAAPQPIDAEERVIDGDSHARGIPSKISGDIRGTVPRRQRLLEGGLQQSSR